MSGNKFDHLLLQLPLEIIDMKDPKVQSGGKDQAKVHFLAQELTRLIIQPSFLRYAPQAFENLQVANLAEYLGDLFKCLKLQVCEQIIFLVALTHTTVPAYRQDAIKLLKIRLKEYHSVGKPQPLPAYAAHRLLLMLLNSPDFRDVAQFVRDSMCKSAQAHPFELDPFFASRFSPFYTLSEDMGSRAPSPSTSILAQPQTGHFVELADLLIDCEPSISMNYPALQVLCADYKDKEFGENRVAELLIKLGNSVAASSLSSEERAKGGVSAAGLFFQATKPSTRNPRALVDLKVNGAAAASLVPATEGGKGWNVDNLAKCFREIFGKINWDKVVDCMDRPEPVVSDVKAFQFILSLYCKCRQAPFPVMRLLGQWKNVDSQVKMLELAISVQDPELINFEHTPRRQARIDTIQGMKATVLPTLAVWCSIDLVERLVELSESAHYATIRGLFEYPMRSCPEYLLLTVAQTQPRGGQFLLDELYATLLPTFLANHVNSIIVIEKLWNINPRLVMKSICNLYRYDPTMMNLSRVLDITQEIKDLLKPTLSLDCYDFTIPLAVLAGKRDFLHFDQWMAERIKAVGEPFIVSLLSYLEENIIKKGASAESADKRLEKSYLTTEKLAVIFENLQKLTNIPAPLKQQIDTIHKAAVAMFPSLVTPSAESPEIEDEANKWFQRVFSGEISVEELIARMKMYKESKDQKQGEIYACMIHNLLDEYRFFAKYPEKELKITGQLFGSIIKHRLVDSLLEKISLKYVFEALKRNGKMLRFGVYAIGEFLDRLKEWPASIELILKMTNFKNLHPDLYQKIQDIYQSVKTSPTPTTGQQGIVEQPSPVIPPIDSPVTSPLPPPNTSFGLSQPSIGQPKMMGFAGTAQQSPVVPPGYPPSYMGGYMYPQSIPGSVPTPPPMSTSPPATLPYPWRHKAGPMQAQSPGSMGFPPLSKATSVPPKHDYYLGAPGGSVRPSDYQNFMKAVENKDFASEYQGLPQNQPGAHFPTLLEGGERPTSEGMMPMPLPLPASAVPVMPRREEVKKPAPAIEDKLMLSLNMITESDYMTIKDATIKYMEADSNTLPWLAYTLVSRAAAQQNNQQLYIKFVNAIQNKQLFSAVLANTCNEIKYILEMNKGNENPDDKTKKTIKNLGIFLGLITIADNKPILAKDLDLKEILIEGYSNGDIALPLILSCQVLRQTINSRVFKPNNPWVRAIFSIIADLMNVPAVTTNFGLRSEITLLYDQLKIPPDYFPPAKIIQSKAAAPPQIYRPLPVYQARHTAPMPITMPMPMPQPMMPPVRSYMQPPAAVPYRGQSPQPQITGIVVNPEVVKVLQSIDPNYMDSVKKAIDGSVLDILKPVIERSVTIALITTREIVIKDFALEPDDKKLLEAANQMVQCLAGSLAMVTCREPLRMSMGNRIKDVLRRYELQTKDAEQIVKTLCNENLEIGSTYIQRSVILKARQRVSDDHTIKESVERRVSMGPGMLTYATPKQIPEPLRPRKEGLSSAELEVYKEFNKVLKDNTTSLLGDISSSAESSAPAVSESDVAKAKSSSYKLVGSLRAIHAIIDNEEYARPEVLDAALKRFQQELAETERNAKMMEQVTREIFQCFVKLFADKASKDKSRIYLQLLRITANFYKNLPTKITELLFKDCTEDIKYNYEFVATLFKHSLIDIQQYDTDLSIALHNIASFPPTVSDSLLTFVAYLVLNLILAEKILQPSQLTHTFMEMNSIHKTPRAQENPAFVSMLLNLSSNDKSARSAASQLFEEWVTLNQDQAPDQLRDYFLKLTAHLGNSDDRFVGFFTTAIEAAVQQALYSSTPAHAGGALVPNYPDRLDFRLIDSVLKLLFTLLPYKLSMCIKYFSNFMRALTNSLKSEHANRLLQFNQRPFYRFFVIILQSLKKPEFKMLPHAELLQYTAYALHDVAPKLCPGFGFGWLDLVAHRNFMPHLLSTKLEDKYVILSGKMVILLCDMFDFLKLVLMSGEQPPATVILYFEAVLRITLVLLHDFPDFLATHYFDFLCAIPEQCLQLRNIILSAVPKNIKAPEAKRGIKIDKLPEQKTPPVFQSDFKQILSYRNIKEDVDKYMVTTNPSLLVDICNKLMSPVMATEASSRAKRPELEVFHALVLYLAEIGIATAYEQPKKELGITPILNSILSKLDLQARESMLNAMFNEVRYPNSYTLYFMRFLLYLMESSSIPLIQEQIFRILLERESGHSPNPWGIIIMLIELRQNPVYDLTNKPFVKGFKEIEAMLMRRQSMESGKED